ncbi:hypothetical protein N0V85_001254 [Neurospora sp. IMI 360204]|nr:hypothetical protein N0V85_001254 [Neurospora sp. IMI 360204]
MFDLSKRRNTGPSISYPVSEPLITPPVSNSPLVKLQQPQTILNFHPTGSTLLSASPSTLTTLDLSVLPNPADPLPYQPKTDSREEPILNACYTNDGLARVVSHSNYTRFTLLSNGQVNRRVAHPVPARVVAIAPDGHRLILGSKDGDIWSLSTSSLSQSEEVTVAVVSGERLTLLSIGDDQDDCCLGWVEFKKRKALIAKIKPRADSENHLEIALWSGGESRITILKFEGFHEKDKVEGGNNFKGPVEPTVAGETENHNENTEEQKKEQDYVYTSTGGISICEGEIEVDGASEKEDDEEEENEKENEEGEGASSSGCGSWVLDGYNDE